MTLTPDQIARIHRVAASGDPFMQGAAWMLIQMTQETPPETPRLAPERRTP